MWYKSENGSNIRPTDIDTTTSKIYVYIRRNIKFIEEQDEVPAHYSWEEKKILKEIWPIYEEQMRNAANIDYIAMMTSVNIEGEE